METDSRWHDSITVKRSLENGANSTISQELHGGDGIHIKGLQQLRQDGRRTNRVVDSRRKIRHEARATINLDMHDEVTVDFNSLWPRGFENILGISELRSRIRGFIVIGANQIVSFEMKTISLISKFDSTFANFASKLRKHL